MKRLIGCATLIAISAYLLVHIRNASTDLKPKIFYTIQDRHLAALVPPPPPKEEASWSDEAQIGAKFAKKLDFYRAITALSRAEMLAPESAKHELQYQTLLCYYLGQRYADAERAFTSSSLTQLPKDSPLYHDLLVILYDTYHQLDRIEQRNHILQLIYDESRETYNHLVLYTALKKADFTALRQIPSTHDLLTTYESHKKSPSKAAILNALLPGAGYFYLSQYQTALTALFINGLFIASGVYFLRRKPIAAAILFFSFEAGWYFGGIQGATAQTRLYNERVYEQVVQPAMNKEGLFPIYELRHDF